MALALALSAASFAVTMLGGLVALRHRDRLHLVLGFAGGALVGVALFDTLPEGSSLLGGGRDALAMAGALAAIGFIGFNVLEQSSLGHVHSDGPAGASLAGHVGAGSLTLHGLLDGFAIGAAFNVSTEIGWLVAFAVIAHRFSDGLVTVSTLLHHGHRDASAIAWLLANAAAPVVGAAAGFALSAPERTLGAILAVFSGIFLYLGAASLLPAAHQSRRDTRLVLAATVAGLGLILALSRLSGL